eukprot:gene31600-35676_t
MDASMVSTTTAQNASAPGPAVTTASELKRTSATHRALARPPARAALRSVRQQRQRAQLGHRHHDTGDEDDGRQCGRAQTETLRTSILNSYTLVFNDGSAPTAVDTSFFSGLGLIGHVGPAGRGRVAGVGITGRDAGYEYTVGFASPAAQYWAKADPASGHFDSTVTLRVSTGGTVALNTIAIAGDPSAAAPLWRIGDWDGTPAEFINGDKVTTMHPSDVRMASWVPGEYQVGASNPASGFPAYQWKNVNGTLTIKFNLTQSQIADYQLRLGITAAFAGGRPK